MSEGVSNSFRALLQDVSAEPGGAVQAASGLRGAGLGTYAIPLTNRSTPNDAI